MPIIVVRPVSNANSKTFTAEATVPTDLTGTIRVFFPMPVNDKTDPSNHFTMEIDVFDPALNDFRPDTRFGYTGGNYVDKMTGVLNPDPSMLASAVDFVGKRVRMTLDNFSKTMRVGCSIEYET